MEIVVSIGQIQFTRLYSYHSNEYFFVFCIKIGTSTNSVVLQLIRYGVPKRVIVENWSDD